MSHQRATSVVEVPAREKRAGTRSSATVAALRQGPGLRKLLGSGADLWEQLQHRARRSEGKPLVVTAAELARTRRPARPVRTVEWGLHRLEEAGLIARRRMRYGVEITVCAFDVDEQGVREFSPRVPAQTVTWMRTALRRGRPKRLLPSQPPAEITFMEEIEPRTEARADMVARVLAHPAVPPSPYRADLQVPKVPTPLLLDKGARPSEHREFLINAYVSISRSFFPAIAVQPATRMMRSNEGRRILDAAAQEFMRAGIAPQAWLVLNFEREHARKRKAPIRPEIVYEPTFIERNNYAFHEQTTGHRMFLQTPVNDEKNKKYTEGIKTLRAFYHHLIKDLQQLPAYDEEAIEALCARYFPKGWKAVYDDAALKMRTIQNEYDQRNLRGEYLWAEAQ
jgi:hypothetical protein